MIQFNYPPTVARKFVDDMIVYYKDDEQNRKICEDIKQIVELGMKQLIQAK